MTVPATEGPQRSAKSPVPLMESAASDRSVRNSNSHSRCDHPRSRTPWPKLRRTHRGGESALKGTTLAQPRWDTDGMHILPEPRLEVARARPTLEATGKPISGPPVPRPLAGAGLLALQRQIGNAGAIRWLELQRCGGEVHDGCPCADTTETGEPAPVAQRQRRSQHHRARRDGHGHRLVPAGWTLAQDFDEPRACRHAVLYFSCRTKRSVCR